MVNNYKNKKIDKSRTVVCEYKHISKNLNFKVLQLFLTKMLKIFPYLAHIVLNSFICLLAMLNVMPVATCNWLVPS